MLPYEKLLTVKTLIIHDNCSDGLASAIILKDAYAQLGLSPEIRFIQYGTDAYKTLQPSGPDVLFCDFSPFVPDIKVMVDGVETKVPDPEKLRPWVESGAMILDHHAGAKLVVDGFGERGVFADVNTEPGVSGALLAFQQVWVPLYGAPTLDAHIREDTESEYFFAGDFAVVAGIRDTWQRTHARWRESCVQNEVLRFYPKDDWLEKVMPFHPGNRGFWAERFKLGDLLWTKHERGIKKCVERAWRFTSAGGLRVVVFEGVRSASDVAEVIHKDADLIMAFDYEVETPKDGGAPCRKIVYSTRSHTSFNCSEFCKQFGGGGHVGAAGFNIDFGSMPPANSWGHYAHTLNPYTLAETLVDLHEQQRSSSGSQVHNQEAERS